VLASWEMTLTEPIYQSCRPLLAVALFHYLIQPTPNSYTRTYRQVRSIYHSRSPQPTTTLDHQLSPRATLRSSAISNASVYSCQPHSLPVTNQHQNTLVDYYSRHHSQCLPQASLLAPALLLPDLCHLSPNESLATQCRVTQT
jgi:hypothetical protein